MKGFMLAIELISKWNISSILVIVIIIYLKEIAGGNISIMLQLAALIDL